MPGSYPYELRLPLAPYRFIWRDDAAVETAKLSVTRSIAAAFIIVSPSEQSPGIEVEAETADSQIN